MANGFDYMDDLIGKVLAGEATPAEMLEVEAWCRADEANQKYFNQLKSIFEKAASAPVQIQFDTDAAWQRMRNKLKLEAKVVPLKPAGFNWQPLRIAAGVILVVVGGIFAYQWWNAPTQTLALVSESKTHQDTLPDSSTVFLNKNSSLSYEYNARQKTRTVKLNGEGYFEVKHEEKKPFVIQADDGVFVRDIGTAFNVRSYPNKDT
ncbi:MAG: FecR family protein, partial [Bacteroidota bacterium]